MERSEFVTAFNAAAGAYSVNIGGGYVDGYTHVEIWEDPNTGVKARAYVDDSGNYILAFAGTEDLKDMYQNLANLGMAQWEEISSLIKGYFIPLRQDGTINSITFTGHSLGGALAQYAAYDFLDSEIINGSDVALTTFNALGGETALDGKYDNYNPDLLNSSNIHHYFDPSDVISKLSPHLGGQDTNYQLRFRTEPVFTLDAHKMDTIQSYIADGTLVTTFQANQEYFNLDEIVPVMQIMGDASDWWSLDEVYHVSDAEAFAKIVSMTAVIPYLMINPQSEFQWEALKGFLIDNVATTVLAPKLGIDSELGILSLKAVVSNTIDAIGYALIQPKLQGLIQAGATLASLMTDVYGCLMDGEQIEPDNKAFSYTLLNYMVGASLNVDAEGHFSEKISEDMVTRISDLAHANNDLSFPKLMGYLGELLGRDLSDSYEDTIIFANEVIEQGIHVAEFLVPATHYNAERLFNLVTEQSVNELITPNPLDATLVRYSILHNLPFILEGVNDEFIDSEILADANYQLGQMSEDYWRDRIEFYQLSLSRNIGDLAGTYEDRFYFDHVSGSMLATGDANMMDLGMNSEQYHFGSSNSELISGHVKNDRLYGAGGNDQLFGEAGNDRLFGGDGNDHLYGGEGNDDLSGGEGDDTFYYVNNDSRFDGHDRISDADPGDRLNINGHLVSQLVQIGEADSGERNYQDDHGNLYTLGENGGLVVTVIHGDRAGSIQIDQFDKAFNNFGLSFNDAEEPDAPMIDEQTHIVGTGSLDAGGTIDASYYDRENNPNQVHINDQNIIYEAEAASNLHSDYGDPERSYQFHGGNENDDLTGGESKDELWGGAGDDYINGRGDNDKIRGGTGNDTINGGDGDDLIYGNDQLFTDQLGKPIDSYRQPYQEETVDSQDIISGGAGNDHISADGGNDRVLGGTGDDVIAGGKGSDTIYGGNGTDLIQGDSARDHVSYLSGGSTRTNYLNEAEEGQSYNDVLFGESGNDFIIGGIGDDTIVGGSGNDWVHGDRHNSANSMVINGQGDSDFSLLNPSLHGNDTLSGGSGDDVLVGDAGNDYIDGGDDNDVMWGDDVYIEGQHHGDDIMSGGAGNDSAIGGGGNDEIHGGSGDDVIWGDESRYEGQNSILLDGVYHGRDTIHGGDGVDTIIAGGNDDVIYGGDGDDTIWADSKYDEYDLVSTSPWLSTSYHGNDTIYGGAGFDTIIAGSGDDTISGGSGDDHLKGNAGNDTYLFASGDGGATVVDTEGLSRFTFTGQYNTDELTVVSGDGLVTAYFSSDLSDYVTMTAETFAHVSEFQFMSGEVVTGLDLLNESQSRYVNGSGGDDRLEGGEGNNILLGGLGNDTYLFSLGGGHDIINSQWDINGFDRISFDSSVSSDGVSFSYDFLRGEINLNYGGAFGDSIELLGALEQGDYFAQGGGIQEIEFANGDSWSIEEIIAKMSTGTSSNNHLIGTSSADSLEGLEGKDVLLGFGGDDVLVGGAHADRLEGGEGADIYRFSAGHGSDVIYDQDVLYEPSTIIEFDADIDPANVSLERDGADLLIYTNPEDTRDVVRVSGMSNGGSNDDFYFKDGNLFDEIRFLSRNETWNGESVSSRLVESTPINDGYSETEEVETAEENLVETVVETEVGTVVESLAENSAPELSNPIPGITVNEDEALLFVIPEDIFVDVDGDTLSYSVSLANGEPLPDWINFTGTALTGIPRNEDVGEIALEVVATDGSVSVSTQFNLTVANVNDAPELDLGIADLSVNEADNVSIDIPSNAFNDQDGDALTYTASLADGSPLPSWLSFQDNGFDGATFTGTPDSGDAGTLSIEVVASDLSGETIADQFTLTINSTSTNLTDTNSPIRSDNISDDNISSDPVNFVGTDADDVVHGSNAVDSIDGQWGNDTLYGYDGDDDLKGYIGDDILVGGYGNDTLNGSIGSDTYIFNIGDGQDTIADTWQSSATNTIQFGEGITQRDLVFQKNTNGNSLEILVGSTGDKITVQYFYASGYQPDKPKINSIQFADGSELNEAELIALIPDVVTEGDDWVAGSSADDVLSGQGGNDIIFAAAGNDSLNGGEGNDSLYGQAGNDTYMYNTGDGNDLISDKEGDNSLVINGEAIAQITETASGSKMYEDVQGNRYEIQTFAHPLGLPPLTTLIVTVGSGMDQGEIRVRDWDAVSNNFGIEVIAAEADDVFVNSDPIAMVDSITTDENTTVMIDVLANDSDPDGDVLSIDTVRAINGLASINSDGTLTYTPNEGFSGTELISYSISDGQGGTDQSLAIVTVTEGSDSGGSSIDSLISAMASFGAPSGGGMVLSAEEQTSTPTILATAL